MRTRLLVAALGLPALLLLVFGSWESDQPQPSPGLPQAAVALEGAEETAEPPPVSLSRNPFEYAWVDDADPSDTRLPAQAAETTRERVMGSVPTASPVAAVVRLVGLVRQAGVLKAALVVVGDVVVLGPGESAGGYTVSSVDVEGGVVLTGPDGEVQLQLP